MTQHVHSLYLAVFCRPGPVLGKKNSTSLAADVVLSEPWQAFSVLSENYQHFIYQVRSCGHEKYSYKDFMCLLVVCCWFAVNAVSYQSTNIYPTSPLI